MCQLVLAAQLKLAAGGLGAGQQAERTGQQQRLLKAHLQLIAGAGHPFAATGGRIVANLAKLLSLAQQGRGLISICAAGGQGVTAILER
jgi:hypothetical protein